MPTMLASLILDLGGVSSKGEEPEGQRPVGVVWLHPEQGHRCLSTCFHLCLYCYANSVEEAVRQNYERHSVEGEGLVQTGEGGGVIVF